MDSDTHPKVVDSEVGDLVLDPVERAVVAGAVLLLHEVRQVGHPGQLVQVRAANIFMVNKYFSNIFRLPGEVVRLQHHGYPELPLRDLHRPPHVVRPVGGVEALPVRHQPGPVDNCRYII